LESGEEKQLGMAAGDASGDTRFRQFAVTSHR
jgi:hypothetical protein